MSRIAGLLRGLVDDTARTVAARFVPVLLLAAAGITGVVLVTIGVTKLLEPLLGEAGAMLLTGGVVAVGAMAGLWHLRRRPVATAHPLLSETAPQNAFSAVARERPLASIGLAFALGAIEELLARRRR